MLNHLELLCNTNGISGRETDVRKEIEMLLHGKCDYRVDAAGNLLVAKKGRKTPAKKIMVSAHMDEVGFIITFIQEDGTLRFSPVGGINPEVAAGRQVFIGEKNISGVIGIKPIHLQSKEEREQKLSFEQMFIDIGADSREQASRVIQLGDSVFFKSDFVSFGNGKIKAKAIDDRFGCAALIRLLLEESIEYDFTAAFVTQEEVGLRGAKVAAYQLHPDISLVLEATTAVDLAGVEEYKRVCELDKGPVLSFMDARTVYDKGLYQLGFCIAAEHQIPCQTKSLIVGGNDAGVISQSRGGVRCLAISLPCRYIHSPSCVASVNDMEASYQLLHHLLIDERMMQV